MRIATIISRYLLGLMFTVFGLNGFLHFIPQPPPVAPLAVQYFTVMATSHYMAPVFLIQLVAGVLLLANRYIPLALTLLAPILVNILLFHILIYPSGIGAGLFATMLWAILFIGFRKAFQGIFQAKISPATV